jgi:hypothetical protein
MNMNNAERGWERRRVTLRVKEGRAGEKEPLGSWKIQIRVIAYSLANKGGSWWYGKRG